MTGPKQKESRNKLRKIKFYFYTDSDGSRGLE